MPVKKRGGRTVLLLVGSIILLIIIIGGIVFGARYVLGKKSASPTPTPTPKKASTLTGQVWEAPEGLETRQLLVAAAAGQNAQYRVVIDNVGAAVVSLRV
jgi:hypothetical protein